MPQTFTLDELDVPARAARKTFRVADIQAAEDLPPIPQPLPATPRSDTPEGRRLEAMLRGERVRPQGPGFVTDEEFERITQPVMLPEQRYGVGGGLTRDEYFGDGETLIPGVRTAMPGGPLEPTITLPRYETGPLFPGEKPAAVLEVGGGLYNALAGAAESLTSPAAAGTLGIAGAGQAVGRLAAGIWAVFMAQAAPEQIREARKAFKEGRPLSAKTEAVLAPILSTTFAATALKAAVPSRAQVAPRVSAELLREMTKDAVFPADLPPVEPRTFTVETLDRPLTPALSPGGGEGVYRAPEVPLTAAQAEATARVSRERRPVAPEGVEQRFARERIEMSRAQEAYRQEQASAKAAAATAAAAGQNKVLNEAGQVVDVVPEQEIAARILQVRRAVEEPRAQLYREAAESRKIAETEWPPVYKQIKEATGATERELEAVGLSPHFTHPSEYRGLATDLGRNAPGGRLNSLYNELVGASQQGRFVWGGTAEAPMIGFEAFIAGGKPNLAAARRSLEIVNKIRETIGAEPLPDWFGKTPATRPAQAGQVVDVVPEQEIAARILQVRRAVEEIQPATSIVHSSRTLGGESRYIYAMIDGEPWAVRISTHSRSQVRGGDWKQGFNKLSEASGSRFAHELDLRTRKPDALTEADIVSEVRRIRATYESGLEPGDIAETVDPYRKQASESEAPRTIAEQLNAAANQIQTGSQMVTGVAQPKQAAEPVKALMPEQEIAARILQVRRAVEPLPVAEAVPVADAVRGQSARFIQTEGPFRDEVFVTPSAKQPGKWQATLLKDRGEGGPLEPSGDVVFDTWEKAIRSAQGETIEGKPGAGSKSFKVAPIEAAAPSPRPSPPRGAREPARPAQARQERPPDLLDAIEGQIGRGVNMRLIREANPSFQPVGAARKLLFANRGEPADLALQSLQEAGLIGRDVTIEQFGELINDAAAARQGRRSEQSREAKLIAAEEAAYIEAELKARAQAETQPAAAAEVEPAGAKYVRPINESQKQKLKALGLNEDSISALANGQDIEFIVRNQIGTFYKEEGPKAHWAAMEMAVSQARKDIERILDLRKRKEVENLSVAKVETLARPEWETINDKLMSAQTDKDFQNVEKLIDESKYLDFDQIDSFRKLLVEFKYLANSVQPKPAEPAAAAEVLPVEGSAERILLNLGYTREQIASMPPTERTSKSRARPLSQTDRRIQELEGELMAILPKRGGGFLDLLRDEAKRRGLSEEQYADLLELRLAQQRSIEVLPKPAEPAAAAEPAYISLEEIMERHKALERPSETVRKLEAEEAAYIEAEERAKMERRRSEAQARGGEPLRLEEEAQPGERYLWHWKDEHLVRRFNDRGTSENLRLAIALEAAQRGLDPASGRDAGLPRGPTHEQRLQAIRLGVPAEAGAVPGRQLAGGAAGRQRAGGRARREPAAVAAGAAAGPARERATVVRLDQVKAGDRVHIQGVPLTVEWWRTDAGSKYQGTLRVVAPDGRWAELRKDGRENIVATRTKARPEVEKGIVSNTAAEAWADRTIAKGRQRLHAGLDPELLAAYAVKGAAIIERGARRFVDWAARMVALEGEAIRPHLRAIFEQAQRIAKNVAPLPGPLPVGRGEGVSKFAARAAVAPEVLTEHQKRMQAEAGLYEPQAMEDVAGLVQRLSNEQLRQIPALTEAGPNNVWVAAKLELYNRLKNANSQEAWGHLEEARQQLTTFGQLVNQAKLLTSATPEGIVATIEHGRRRDKLPPLAPADKGELVILADKTLETQKKANEAETEYGRTPTDENVTRVEKARREADAAQRLLEEKKRGTEPRGFADTLIQVIQGNVLSPISQARNVGGNIANIVAHGGERSGALLADLFWRFVANGRRDIWINPARSAPQQLAALRRSWADMKRIWTQGESGLDPSKLDIRRNLHPLLALRDIKLKKWKGMKLGEKAALALEASPFAMHAAAQLRLLGVGDVGFRATAKARLITEAMALRRINAAADLKRLQKQPMADLSARVRIAGLRRFLSGPDRTAHAVRIPERFFSKEELSRIELESQRVTFQEPNPVAKYVLSGARRLPAPVRLFARMNAAFITTPLNFIKQMYQFNPLVAAAQFYRHAAKGESREAKLAFGRMLYGGIVGTTGYLLARAGLLAPPLDDPSEAQKGRLLSEATGLPANSLNLSGIKRLATGGDPAWRAGDEVRDISQLGITGFLLHQGAFIARQRERKPEATSALGFAEDLFKDSTLGGAQYGLQQSFLRNTESALHAVASGQDHVIDAWTQGFLETAMSVPFPNTLAAFSRASRQWKPEVRGDGLDQRLNNIVKNRLDFAMPGQANLPLRRGLWGEPLPETPEGALPYLHQFLDITKGRTVPEDPLNITLYTLWRRTADAGVIPTPPDRSITIDQETYPLTREQHSRLQELVGKARRDIADEIVVSPDFLQLTAQEKIAELKDIWREGSQGGTKQFVDEREQELKAKPKPSGLSIP